MRFLRREDNDSYRLVDDPPDLGPGYAILSHTWALDNTEEVTYDDIGTGREKTKPGYQKIQFCAKLAADNGLRFFWIDTCCIDKSSTQDIRESINAMFEYYQGAKQCYVNLSDVSVPTEECLHIPRFRRAFEKDFRKSRWFTRGWTLQELVAPRWIRFYSKEGTFVGNKHSLDRLISEITRIPIDVLRGREYCTLDKIPIRQIMSWSYGRQTRREEDMIYSLLGILQVRMDHDYGEKYDRAKRRLLEAVEKDVGSDDFSWSRQQLLVEQRFNDLLEIRERRDCCLNCGSRSHEEEDCGLGGCGKCLKETHTVSDCTSPVHCIACKEEHHMRGDIECELENKFL